MEMPTRYLTVCLNDEAVMAFENAWMFSVHWEEDGLAYFYSNELVPFSVSSITSPYTPSVGQRAREGDVVRQRPCFPSCSTSATLPVSNIAIRVHDAS